jgi:hypothetical protein
MERETDEFAKVIDLLHGLQSGEHGVGLLSVAGEDQKGKLGIDSCRLPFD